MPPETGRLQEFVAALLVQEGALVAALEPDGLEVLAPPAVQHLLDVPELCGLGFGATLPANARRVGLEQDWLERFGRLLGERGRCTRLVLHPEVRAPSDPERALGHELVLDNATFRLLGITPAWTRYLVFSFRFAALSEEKREGLLSLGVNLATGALPDAVLAQIAPQIAPWLDGENSKPAPPDEELPALWEPERVRALIEDALPSRLQASLAPFVKALLRRLGRDQDRLHAYHDELHQDAMRRLSGISEGDPARPREELRIAAIKREYQAKIDDLSRQYAMRVSVEWVQTLDLAMPVQRFEIQLRRRKGERVIHLDWNPLARRLEAPACEYGRSSERPRLLCDQAMHLVTPAGLACCAGCSKPFCRACHREACPKCGHPVRRFVLISGSLQ